jgi:hypothetical protein
MTRALPARSYSRMNPRADLATTLTPCRSASDSYACAAAYDIHGYMTLLPTRTRFSFPRPLHSKFEPSVTSDGTSETTTRKGLNTCPNSEKPPFHMPQDHTSRENKKKFQSSICVLQRLESARALDDRLGRS